MTEYQQFVDDVVAGYIECALWAGLDWDDQVEGNPVPLDDNYDESDLSDQARESIYADVVDFLAANHDDVRELDPSQVGHDFFLTRNHHGAGFWDRGLGDVGGRLTKAAYVYGASDLHAGDDGQLYVP